MRSAPFRPFMVLGLAVPLSRSSPSVPWQLELQTFCTPSWAKATPAPTSSASMIDAINSMGLFIHAPFPDARARASPALDATIHERQLTFFGADEATSKGVVW